jgi:hypothetical protein
MKYQQGDVLLIQTNDESVKDGKKLDHLILAEGEKTGHNHQIVSGIATLIAIGDKRILNVLSDYALLKHQEHKEINIQKGKYEVKIVQEYDHFDEEAKRVAD